MFQKLKVPGTSGSNIDPSQLKQRVASVAKILLDIAKESADWFPPLKSALGGVGALINHYEQFADVRDKIKDLKPQLDRFKQTITTTTIDGDPEENERRKKLISVLEEVEKRSQELLAKGSVAKLVDKESDSGEVVSLVERFREAIAHYQISQQQAIYVQVTNLASSFATFLQLHEKSLVGENKLNPAMTRLDRLCLEEDYDEEPWDETEHERRTKLFDTLRLIRDRGNELRNRISAQGYEGCQDDIQVASALADDIRDAVIDYQTTLQWAIYDRNRKLIDDADLSVLNGCRRADGAGHKHGGRKDCLSGTRETILNEIESWARDFNKPPVFWLNGLAGTGKSTIAQTVSKRLFADGLLGASFFCSRDFDDRRDLHLIFPTLAFQLGQKYESFRLILVPLLRSNPEIVHEPLTDQMEELMVKPLKSADVTTIIVIDALDECEDEESSSTILSVLEQFVEQIPKVKFFITGRPEPRIKKGFRLPFLVDSTDVFVLHDVHHSLIDSDIRLFLKHELSELARRHQLEEWPSNDHIDILCRRASGLFVYAVATVKFLGNKTGLPDQLLDTIVGLPESTVPEGETRFNSKTTLDLLYTSILQEAFREADPKVYPEVRSTIGAVILLVNPLPPSAIAELIDLDPRGITLFLTLIQSLLVLDEDSSKPVKLFHKSFPDFITDPSRCTDMNFYISPKNGHLELAINCLRVMNGRLEQHLPLPPIYDLELDCWEIRIDIPTRNALQYACQSWHNHLNKIWGDATDADYHMIYYLHIFLKDGFLVWLEAIRFMKEDNEKWDWDCDDLKQQEKCFNTLRLIRDDGVALCDHIETQGYKGHQEDIQAISGIAGNIWNTITEYQIVMQQAIYNQQKKWLVKILDQRHAHGAGYQHGDRKGCLNGTRETVLNEIELWAGDFNKSPILWLNGLASTGKSTISQTVCERFLAGGLLGASFFCSRDFEDRSSLHFIFPTLSFQLAHKYPTFRSILVPLLQSNPYIVHASLVSQMGQLIVDPLKLVDVTTIIVIDALDECKDKEPSSAILSVLGRFVEQIPKVKFFITGRPEPWIRAGFRLPPLVDSTDVCNLHEVEPSLITNDIRLFLKHELSELARRHRLEGWPTDEQIDVLCRRADPLFAYAVATVKFLDSSTHPPEQRLDVILNSPGSTIPEGKTRLNPRTTLDSLYTSILETGFGEGDAWMDCRARSIIGTVILTTNPLSLSAIAELIGLRPPAVTSLFRVLWSLFTFDEHVKPFHKSFPDFITDPSRCTRFYISPEHGHLELAMNCLRVMNGRLDQNLLSLPDYSLNSEVEDLQTKIGDHISDALRYACRSWHNHLTNTGGDVTDVISYLRAFLEEKFLAWLEVVSVLGAVRGAIASLEHLISWLGEVSGDEGLLDTVRDYANFLITFFDPINSSATHIYHSALELSPLSSIVRMRYHHRRQNPLPRVIVGTQESWEPRAVIPGKDGYFSYTWSPCGRFITAVTHDREAVEIRDSLNSELVSTLKLTNPTPGYVYHLAYSRDGCSIASISDTSLIIWDIQTRRVTNEIGQRIVVDASLVWSSDGSRIAVMEAETAALPETKASVPKTYAVRTYEIASGTMELSGTFQSTDKPHLWADGTSFQVMRTTRTGQGCTIRTLAVGPALSEIESFPIDSRGVSHLKSFSPSTYRISASLLGRLVIIDIRNSECLLEQGVGYSRSECFSSDGSLFAASLKNGVHIWKYTSGRYTLWRDFSQNSNPIYNSPLQFSPTLSSLSGCYDGTLHLWYLDGLPTLAHPGSREQLVIPSRCGSYITTSRKGASTVTIANLCSQTSSHIDMGVVVQGLTLTGNVLLVQGYETITAWRLTEEGVVDGAFADGRVGHSNSIWTIPLSSSPTFLVEDQAVVIEVEGTIVHAYHPGTGEVLKVQAIPHPRCQDNPDDIPRDSLYPYIHRLGMWSIPSNCGGDILWRIRGGWVMDPEGKHRLWLPTEWRDACFIEGWPSNREALRLDLEDRTVIVEF